MADEDENQQEQPESSDAPTEPDPPDVDESPSDFTKSNDDELNER